MPERLRGLVLTGGESRRMGTDKAVLCYHGIAQWRLLGDWLGALCDEVFWSCTAAQKSAWRIGRRGLVDEVSGRGPAEGLRRAFTFSKATPWLVVACDYPFLGPEDLKRLVTRRQVGRAAIAFRNPEDRLPEPLLAVWEIPAQEKLVQAVAAGTTSPRRVLNGCDPLLVDPTHPRALTNINCAPSLRGAQL